MSGGSWVQSPVWPSILFISKTLPITLCTLLDNPVKKKVTIVVSPLKWLQKSQANEFTTCFGICAVAINEDMPQNSTWWSISHLFMTYITCIYSYIYRKTYSPLNAMKCTCNSSSSLLNSFFKHLRDISLKWPFYCNSLPSSLSFLGSVSMRLTCFILLLHHWCQVHIIELCMWKFVNDGKVPDWTLLIASGCCSTKIELFMFMLS